MKRIIVLSFLVLAGCTKDKVEKKIENKVETETVIEMPECVEQKIVEFNAECCENGANVKEYIFQDQMVYVFDLGNCGADMTSEVISEDCDHLGFLGGFSGNLMINGENFNTSTYVRTVWVK